MSVTLPTEGWSVKRNCEDGAFLFTSIHSTRADAIAAHVRAAEWLDFDTRELYPERLLSPSTEIGQEQRRVWRRQRRKGVEVVRVVMQEA